MLRRAEGLLGRELPQRDGRPTKDPKRLLLIAMDEAGGDLLQSNHALFETRLDDALVRLHEAHRDLPCPLEVSELRRVPDLVRRVRCGQLDAEKRMDVAEPLDI